ncbi:ATP-binding protein [Falsiroseomonas sp.]|uniref:ATP-binding protein n=1 Tax=Falsiroseomonas sp. TaxID=2870721 RepID=UPI00356514BF
MLVPLAAFCAAALVSWYQVTGQAEARLARTAEMLQEHALRAFEAQNAALIAVAALMRDRDWDGIRASHSLRSVLAALDRAAPATAGVALIAPNGELALASRVEVPAPPIDLSEREYVVAHHGGGSAALLAGSGTFVGEISPGAVTGRPVFRLSRPHLNLDGLPDGGVVSTAFFPAYFSDFWQSVVESADDMVWLVRHDGAVLARQPEHPDPVGVRLVPGDLLEAVRDGRAARSRVHRLEPEPGLGERLVAIYQLRGFPVSVAYALDPGILRRDWLRRLPAPALGAAAAAALLLLLTGRAQAAAARARIEADRRGALEAQLRRSETGAAVGQLAAGVAHDFGNVAQAVASGARLIECHSGEPDRVRQAAALMAGAAERAARLSARMLGFARRGGGGPAGALIKPYDPGAALAEVAELLAQTLGAGTRVRFEHRPPRPPQVIADRAELESAIINLCVNARDAMPAGGNILITATGDAVAAGEAHAAGLDPGAYARIDVRDTGTGMDEETLARVGEPFFTTKPQGQGTGLGLSMARGFAVRAGGALRIESEVGQGTTVSIWLPAAQQDGGSAR